MTAALACPTCGAPLRERFRGPELVVCEHCGSFVAIAAQRLTVVGRAAPLVRTPTRFALGATIRVRGVPCECVGHVRYDYDDGAWDEWQLARPDGTIVRLQEDEGDLVLWATAVAGAPVSLAGARPGGALPLFGRTVRVSEIGRARVVGAEGSLERIVTPATPFDYVDGHAAGGVVSVRSSRDASLCLTGEPLAFEDVET